MPESCCISCDWGSSRVRMRLVRRADGKILAEASAACGATVLAAGAERAAERARRFERAFEDSLVQLARAADCDLTGMPAVLSGMVTSAHGWHELPYADTPVSLTGSDLVVHTVAHAGHTLLFVSGVRTALDVMRGEETELVGLAAAGTCPVATGDALVVMPGTHSKHVVIGNGSLTDFATHMTGELYALLRNHSVLRYSLDEPVETEFDRNAFVRALRAAVGGCSLTQQLFSVRAGTLLRGDAPAHSAAYVNGLLLGVELRQLQRTPSDLPIVLCAAGRVSDLYHMALNELGLGARTTVVNAADVDHLSCIGHLQLAQRHL